MVKVVCLCRVLFSTNFFYNGLLNMATPSPDTGRALGELLVKEKLVLRPAADDNVRRIFMITVTFIYCAAERNLISHPL